MTMTPEQRELIEEGRKHETALTNGHRGDPGAMSDALSYLIRSQRIQLHAEFVSDKECRTRMSLCPGAKPVVYKPDFSATQAWTWIAGIITACATILGAIHIIFGK